MKLGWYVLIILLLVMLSGLVHATSVQLLPELTLSATNREYNLTLNNLNDKEPITNITIESPLFTFTQAFGGAQWAVSHTEHVANWDNNSLGTDVVYALFPFRATSPTVEEEMVYNFSVTLRGPTTVQRLHKFIKVVPLITKTSVFSLSNSIVKRGITQTVRLVEVSSGASDFKARFLGSDIELAKGDGGYLMTITVPSGTDQGSYPLVITGLVNGNAFEQVSNISVIPSIQISLSAPIQINTSQGFLLSGKVSADDNRSLKGKQVTVFWQDGEHLKTIDSEHDFIVGLLGPSEKGEFTAIVQFELEGLIYSQKKTIKVSDLIVTSNVTNVTVAPVKKTAKTKIKDVSTGRTAVVDVDPVRSRRNISFRPFLLAIFIIVIVVLVLLAFSNINVQLFSRKKEKELDEEGDVDIDWDDYFEKRRRDDDE